MPDATRGRRTVARRGPCGASSNRVHGRVALTLAFACVALHARADIMAGIGAYELGDFRTARTALQQSAELGDGRAQFAMGAMLVKGQGGDKDVPRGLGWLLASVENGYTDAKPQVESWRINVSHLSAGDRARTEQVLDEYGVDGVRKRLMPVSGLDVSCAGHTEASVSRAVTPGYPKSARRHTERRRARRRRDRIGRSRS